MKLIRDVSARNLEAPDTPKERRPPGGWNEFPLPEALRDSVLCGSTWKRKRWVVLSVVEMAQYPDGDGIGPQWHVSVTVAGKRVAGAAINPVLRAFGMQDAEEDNHHPGNARNFWMPIDPAHRVDCECKETEVFLTEPDGYRWTNPAEGDGACRGCEFERAFGRKCPIHAEGARG